MFSFDLEKHVVDDYGLDEFGEMFEFTDILMPNKLGIKALKGRDDLVETASMLLDYGPRLIVVTLGASGNIVVTENEVLSVPAFKIRPVVTTGAGDAFNAAFICAYAVRGLDFKSASVFANAAAALKYLRVGAQSSPRIGEVKRFLIGHGYDLVV